MIHIVALVNRDWQFGIIALVIAASISFIFGNLLRNWMLSMVLFPLLTGIYAIFMTERALNGLFISLLSVGITMIIFVSRLFLEKRAMKNTIPFSETKEGKNRNI